MRVSEEDVKLSQSKRGSLVVGLTPCGVVGLMPCGVLGLAPWVLALSVMSCGRGPVVRHEGMIARVGDSLVAVSEEEAGRV